MWGVIGESGIDNWISGLLYRGGGVSKVFSGEREVLGVTIKGGVKGGEEVRGCDMQCIIQGIIQGIIQSIIQSRVRVVARVIKIVRVRVIQKGGGGGGGGSWQHMRG